MLSYTNDSLISRCFHKCLDNRKNRTCSNWNLFSISIARELCWLHLHSSGTTTVGLQYVGGAIVDDLFKFHCLIGWMHTLSHTARHRFLFANIITFFDGRLSAYPARPNVWALRSNPEHETEPKVKIIYMQIQARGRFRTS